MLLRFWAVDAYVIGDDARRATVTVLLPTANQRPTILLYVQKLASKELVC